MEGQAFKKQGIRHGRTCSGHPRRGLYHGFKSKRRRAERNAWDSESAVVSHGVDARHKAGNDAESVVQIPELSAYGNKSGHDGMTGVATIKHPIQALMGQPPRRQGHPDCPRMPQRNGPRRMRATTGSCFRRMGEEFDFRTSIPRLAAWPMHSAQIFVVKFWLGRPPARPVGGRRMTSILRRSVSLPRWSHCASILVTALEAAPAAWKLNPTRRPQRAPLSQNCQFNFGASHNVIRQYFLLELGTRGPAPTSAPQGRRRRSDAALLR
jgi:hypothetical protein